MIGDNSKSVLQNLIQRIENLEVQKKEIAEDIRDLFKEAKENGFDTKAMRAVMRIRLKPIEHTNLQEKVDLYMQALGMLADTPLGEAAIERVRHAEG